MKTLGQTDTTGTVWNVFHFISLISLILWRNADRATAYHGQLSNTDRARRKIPKIKKKGKFLLYTDKST
jgi:hypothetical protein